MSNETYDQLERAVQDALADLERPGAQNQKEVMAKVSTLTELLLSADKIEAEYYDKQERRRIEEERNHDTAQIERDKAELTWKRVMFEFAKTFGPLALSIGAYGVFQTRLLRFEEEGRLTSSASRELHLPNFFKK